MSHDPDPEVVETIEEFLEEHSDDVEAYRNGAHHKQMLLGMKVDNLLQDYPPGVVSEELDRQLNQKK